MASNGKLSFSVSLQLLSDGFKKGAGEVKNSLRSLQMQFISFAGALGAGVGLNEFVSNMIQTARETNKVNMILKNVSTTSAEYGKSQKFLIDLSKKYNLELNNITGTFAKFSAAANLLGVPMEKQQKIFDAFSKQIVKFGGGAETTQAVFTALEQMFSKGTIQAQEMKIQLGNALPGAVGLFANALGVSTKQFGKMMEQGKLLSAEVLPKIADYLQNMDADVNVDTIEGSLNKLKNSFKELTDRIDVGGIYKKLVDSVGNGFKLVINNFTLVGNAIVNVIASVIIGKGINSMIKGYNDLVKEAYKAYVKQALLAKESYSKQAFEANQAFNTLSFGAAKFGLALKSALISFAPMAIVSGLMAIYQYFVAISDKTKEINSIWGNYKKEASNITGGGEVERLKSLLSVTKDRKKSDEERNTAQQQLLNMLGLEKKAHVDLNKEVAKKVKLLEDAANADFYINKKTQTNADIKDIYAKYNTDGKNNGEDNLNKYYQAMPQGQGKIDKMLDDAFNKLAGNFTNTEVKQDFETIVEKRRVVKDADVEIGKSIVSADNTIKPKKEKEEHKLTDLEKVEQDYKDELKGYKNQKDNEAIKPIDYNKLVDELNKKTFEKLSSMLSVKDAKNNDTFKLAKKGVDNKLFTEKDEAGLKLDEEKVKYADELERLTKRHQIGELTDEQLKEKKVQLIDSTVDAILSIKNIKDGGDDFIKQLSVDKKALPKNATSKDLNKWDYKSQYDAGVTDKEKAQFSLEQAKNELEELKKSVTVLTDDLVKELDEKLAKVDSLDKALKLTEVREKIKDIKKEISKGLYGGVKDVANSAKNLYEAWKGVGDVISNVDSTGWDKFLAIWNALTNTVDSIMSVVNTIEQLIKLTKDLGIAKKAEQMIDNTVTAQKVSNVTTEAAAQLTGAAVASTTANTEIGASTAKGTTEAVAGAAKGLPFPLNILAMGAAFGLATAIFSKIGKKFANGGIVGGSSFAGDKVPILANSGEMIVNQADQSRLFGLISGKNQIHSNNTVNEIELVVKSDSLRGVMKNGNNKRNRTR